MNIVEAQKYGSGDKGTFVEVGLANSHIYGDEYDSGGAGIITTVGDYIKLASDLANFGLGLNGERILAKSTVELMRTNTLNETQRQSFNWKQLISNMGEVQTILYKPPPADKIKTDGSNH